MRRDDWLAAERLFLAAADLDAGARAALLSQACPGDSPLRREVETLLAVDRRARAGTFISDAIARALDKCIAAGGARL